MSRHDRCHHHCRDLLLCYWPVSRRHYRIDAMIIALTALCMISGFLFGWALQRVTRDKPEKAE